MKKIAIAAICGLGALSISNSALAETEYSSFDLPSSTLTVPVLSVDGTDSWIGDLQIQMNFGTNTFSILDGKNIDAPVPDETGGDDLEGRLSALEILLSESLAANGTDDIGSRLTLMEEIFGALPNVGNTIQERIVALDTTFASAVGTTDIQTGRYFDPTGFCFDLSGPFPYSDTRSSYLMRACDDSTVGVIEILTGPFADHPSMESRLIDAEVPSNRFYGLVSNPETRTNSPFYYNIGWQRHAIVGFRQIGGGLLSMEAYTDNSNNDLKLPHTTRTLTKEEE